MNDVWHIPTKTAPTPTSPERLETLYRRLTGFPLAGIPASAQAFEACNPSIDLGNNDAVRSFIDEALERMDVSEAAEFRGRLEDEQPDLVSIAGVVHQRVAPKIDDNFVAAYYRRIFDVGLRPMIEELSHIVNDPARRAGKAGTVIFVCRKGYNVIQREAKHLRKQGYRCFLISLAQVSSGFREAYADCFEEICDGITSYVALGLVIEALEADIFHVQCHMWEYILARFVIERKRTAKVICEFYDITSIYAEREDLARAFWPEIVDLDLATERYIFHHADGVVHRFPRRVIEKLEARYGVTPPSLEQHLYASLEFARHETQKFSDTDGKIRLVYIGGLVPRLTHAVAEMYPEWGHLEAWEALLKQGFAVDVLCSPYRPPEGPGFAPYHDLAARNSDFRVMTGVPPDQLADVICRYDFGLILADMDRSKSHCTPELFDGAVGTKLFAYFEAGLPVLVNSEYVYMTEIAERDGLGLSMASDEISTGGDRIRGFDRIGAAERIRKFNETNAMDQRIHELINLYNSC